MAVQGASYIQLVQMFKMVPLKLTLPDGLCGCLSRVPRETENRMSQWSPLWIVAVLHLANTTPEAPTYVQVKTIMWLSSDTECIHLKYWCQKVQSTQGLSNTLYSVGVVFCVYACIISYRTSDHRNIHPMSRFEHQESIAWQIATATIWHCWLQKLLANSTMNDLE